MPDNALVIPAEDLDIRVSLRKITDFPATGTFMTIEKITPRSTAMEGRNGSVTFVRNGSKLYRVTLSVLQGHPDDVYLAAAIKALGATTNVLGFSYKLGPTVYTSTAMDVETEPTRELAADGSPVMAYAMVGIFPLVVVGRYNQPEVLTEDAIAAFQP